MFSKTTSFALALLASGSQAIRLHGKPVQEVATTTSTTLTNGEVCAANISRTITDVESGHDWRTYSDSDAWHLYVASQQDDFVAMDLNRTDPNFHLTFELANEQL